MQGVFEDPDVLAHQGSLVQQIHNFVHIVAGATSATAARVVATPVERQTCPRAAEVRSKVWEEVVPDPLVVWPAMDKENGLLGGSGSLLLLINN